MRLQDHPKAFAIMGCAMRVHKALGHGFLESAYGDALELEFQKNNIPYIREDEIYIYYEGTRLKTRYRADFTCFNKEYIIELKALRNISKFEWAQVIHYLRATQIPYALLINFGKTNFQYESFELAKLPSL